MLPATQVWWLPVSGKPVSEVSTAPGQMLLGFGAREMWLENWDHERRSALLFRLDVAKPLSVDEMVWPSVFDADHHLLKPDWTGYIQDLWDDLDRLKMTLEEGWRQTWRPCCLVAVTLMTASCTRGQEDGWRERVDSLSPQVIAGGWRLLGFDVADSFLLSGLSNGGFRPELEAVSPLRAVWGPLLNRWHLFTDTSAATAFQKLANSRMPEHSPFFIFAVWLIDQIAPSKSWVGSI